VQSQVAVQQTRPQKRRRGTAGQMSDRSCTNFIRGTLPISRRRRLIVHFKTADFASRSHRMASIRRYVSTRGLRCWHLPQH
jgi:hypothetical protein